MVLHSIDLGNLSLASSATDLLKAIYKPLVGLSACAIPNKVCVFPVRSLQQN